MNVLTEYIALVREWPHVHAGFSFLIYHYANKHVIMWGRDNKESSATLMLIIRWIARALCFVPVVNVLVLLLTIFSVGTEGSGHHNADFGD
jgi:hypothetical protein